MDEMEKNELQEEPVMETEAAEPAEEIHFRRFFCFFEEIVF